MTQKNIVLCIILTIVTCGIYGIYWYYTIADNIYRLNNNLPTTPGITVLLYIVTGGIYGMYAYYKWGESMQQVCSSRGMPGSDRAVLYLILAIFQLSIVNMALIQSDLNQLAQG